VGLNWDHTLSHDDDSSSVTNLHHVPDHSELSEQHAHVLSNAMVAISEQQFVTTLLEGELITDVVLRDTGGHPTTMRELEERRRAMEESLATRGLDISGDVAKKVLKDFDPLTLPEQALRYKEEGNKAFKDCDYGQAGVHYTQAIETFQNCPPLPEGSTDTTVKDGLCASLSNRAACSLKLGDHANALKDCETCLAIDPLHVKCLFRKGLALHAMGRYREACPALGKALQLEPKNAQIQSALTFAERKAMTNPT
ncbi:Sgtb, partial [Symbiodinium microadriaticum]